MVIEYTPPVTSCIASQDKKKNIKKTQSKKALYEPKKFLPSKLVILNSHFLEQAGPRPCPYVMSGKYSSGNEHEQPLEAFGIKF